MREITTNIIMTTSPEIINITMIAREKMEDTRDRDSDIMIQTEGMKKLLVRRLSEKLSLKNTAIRVSLGVT